jgi:hypothetical protein
MAYKSSQGNGLMSRIRKNGMKRQGLFPTGGEETKNARKSIEIVRSD